MTSDRTHPARCRSATCSPAGLGLMLALITAVAPPAAALVRFDFDQAYYAHPGRQVWDFSVTRVDSVYHIFYHTILESTPHSSYGDTIWHATSSDLIHWDEPGPIIVSGTGAWDASAVWAPDIFRDEAGARWGLAYTGADAGMNQRLGLAWSEDLVQWSPAANPVHEPEPGIYAWDPAGTWSDFRDPFLWRQDDTWHLLLTAKQDWTGVLYHAVSADLAAWTDVGPLFRNDGPTPGRVLESPQYHVIDGVHHLLFGEFDSVGISHVAAADPADLTMASRTVIDNGYAPELDEFDPGVRIISRIAPFTALVPGRLSYVVRFDTLLVTGGGLDMVVHRPHPLDVTWASRTGTACLGNPTYGDNPRWRGEPSVGLVGNGYFGSQEYYQGPLSGRGVPGSALGEAATGTLVSHPFVVEGDRMTLLVGGGEDPENLYVALVDAATDTILVRSTGNGDPRLQPRTWNLRPFQGRLCRLRIVDTATGPGGFINVDEIVEVVDPPLAAVPAAPVAAVVSAVPNPFNPRTEIRWNLATAGRVEVRIHDTRGRLVWSDGGRRHPSGPGAAAWDGRDLRGHAAPAGTYLGRVTVDGRPYGTVKLSLVR
ncbi:MAG: hypothetical protein IH621_06020 [Krumholzibacteria bacterium]|nr:hypothetical protein [Candidatus Krumholzibacteria bacterium]